jgi:hypothetical protein
MGATFWNFATAAGIIRYPGKFRNVQKSQKRSRAADLENFFAEKIAKKGRAIKMGYFCCVA